MATTSPAAGASGELPRVSFDGKDAPIRSVVVYTNNMAEVKRVVNFSSATKTGLQEVELAGLPSGFVIVEQSVTVKGSGQCTILDVSFSEGYVKHSPPELTAEQAEEKEAEKDRVAKKIETLVEEQFALSQQFVRSQSMRQLADRFVDRATYCSPVVDGADAAAAAAAGAAAAGAGAGGAAASTLKASLDVESVSNALDWWAAKSAETDQQLRRTTKEGRRVAAALKELTERQNAVNGVGGASESPKYLGRVNVTLDVEELGPIELEVTYLIIGARWSPAYDLRVDTQTNSMSCTYYGRVCQATTEDWLGVSLRLSTAQPTFHGNPPSLQNKAVSFKPSGPFGDFQPQAGVANSFVPTAGSPAAFGAGGAFGCPPTPANPAQSSGAFGAAAGVEGGRPAPAGGFHYGGQPPQPPQPPQPLPPAAKTAMAQVEGGDCGTGAVSFAVGIPATVRGDGKTRKLTIAVLKLSTVVTHYMVPSREPAAYLQAKATNNTDYLLLASNSVSVFLDNSYTSRTSMAFVSPGETFQTFLGMDPTIQTTVAPPRRASKTKGMFGKVDHVTHTFSTSISNRKKVPVTCVVADSMPHPTDESIKVSLQQPVSSEVRDCDATNDESLVMEALEMFGGGGGRGEGGNDDAPYSGSDAAATAMTSAGGAAASVVQTGAVGVAKCPGNHLVWVVNIAPQEEIQIPFEYTVEWPTGKEIQFTE